MEGIKIDTAFEISSCDASSSSKCDVVVEDLCLCDSQEGGSKEDKLVQMHQVFQAAKKRQVLAEKETITSCNRRKRIKLLDPLPPPEQQDVISLEKEYVERLKPHQFRLMDIWNDNEVSYSFTIRASRSTASSPLSFPQLNKMKRLGLEVKRLENDLPLHVSSAIAVRVDESHPDIMKCLITGPSSTPYDSGCFEFDISCYGDFPNSPPKMRLTTTGNGKVRFNPNLYSNGTVCLSLLGTWKGDHPDQEWSPSSSLWQVLISIQSAILGVEFPYFNEPGFENLIGTAEGEKSKRTDIECGYETLRVSTILHGMADHISSPPAGFKDFIENHFFLKRIHIMDVIYNWLKESTFISNNRAHFVKIEDAFKKKLLPQFVRIKKIANLEASSFSEVDVNCRINTLFSYCNGVRELELIKSLKCVSKFKGNLFQNKVEKWKVSKLLKFGADPSWLSSYFLALHGMKLLNLPLELQQLFSDR